MQLSTFIDDREQRFPLLDRELLMGRGTENDVVLSDFSVSRRHAVIRPRQGQWWVHDLASTNGLVLNGKTVSEAPLSVGDVLTVGCFELRVVAEDGREDAAPSVRASQETLPDEIVMERRADGDTVRGRLTPDGDRKDHRGSETDGSIQAFGGQNLGELSGVSGATIVRPLADFTAQYGLAGSEPQPASAPQDPDRAHRIVGFLTRLASSLLKAGSVDEVLTHAMSLIFDALAVDRGFILLQDDDGKISCQLARSGDHTELRPEREVPVSRTILDTVIREQVALLTFDAMSDQRWTTGESIRLHQIRSAMSVPLWSGERIIGVLQVDSPVRVGTFDQSDLDFLTAVANYAAVAVERLRYAQRVETERRWRGRLERYHSPAVIEEVMRRSEIPADEEAATHLRTAEVTVLFADLVGFTALAERLSPEELAQLLEGFFTEAAEAVFSAGGTLDKFIGDCVMAFFGAPMEQPDHALRGVRAAQQILNAVDRWNQRRGEQGQSPLVVRVALNSGPVVVGDIGSNRRVDYTVLGNTVNVASRLEEQASGGGEIIIGPETHRLLAGQIPTESLGEMRLRGLSDPVEPYRVQR
ncbi:MAG: adenylate/guanylate cyclase domain-containing protein [Acidobacteriota bacterium]|nr:adenylate/guanylate cyclase domain-containing protein [Acidobacteriota bacterium]